jgi:signal transduction histidine kinase
MKLLYKYSRINLVTSVLIFLLASIAFYFSLHYVLLKQVDEDLKTEKHEIEGSVQRYGKLPEIIPLNDEITEYKNIAELNDDVTISSLKIHDEENELFRRIVFRIRAAGKNYEVTVAKSLENTEAITKSVLTIAGISIFILIIAGFIINRIVLKRLWMPFYKSMALMKDYRIGHKPYPVFGKTDITEFAMLNETLNTTISNSEHEYKNLKEFTENASHEMQTPVAVIRSKMDVLIQDENLSESQSNIVQGAYGAIKKLARLNQALLLLTRIENRQYSQTEPLQLNILTEEKLSYFNEILQNKQISVSSDLQPVQVNMNAVLADILLNNLISNCIRHSKSGDSIAIQLTAEQLIISNGPFNTALDGRTIFKRFHKGGNSNDEHGLGLAIVKEICFVTGFTISYNFENNMHSFIVSLKQDQ